MNNAHLMAIMRGEDRSATGSVARGLAAILEPAYRSTIYLRNFMFDKGIRPVRRVDCAVISVGNITTGGTGKTPMVAELARRLITLGAKPAILIRGYKTVGGLSDETCILADELGPSVPIESNPDRLASAQRVLTSQRDVSVFLLDDGFQHRRIGRDLDLVLVDATEPFGFGRVLPRGLLREPIHNLSRADAVIVTRADQVSSDRLAALDEQIRHITSRSPIAHAIHQWQGFRDQQETAHRPDTLKDARVITVCGIANPDPFRRMLRQHVRQIIDTHVFADHHHFTRNQIHKLVAAARGQHADAIVTTEKDWVKWRMLSADLSPPPPVYRPILRIAFLDGGATIDQLLHSTMQRHSRGKAGG